MKKDIIFLVGSTVVGKTEVSLRLARLINAEIISCDSMQVYKISYSEAKMQVKNDRA